ncbi:MAG: hypothetical protein N4A46_11170, partial [Schleiferiaceae bacterium]|nr:hypothetical protein [Schleiferiaceae bacterium]
MKKQLLILGGLLPTLLFSQPASKKIAFNGLTATIYADGAVEETQYSSIPGKYLNYSSQLWMGGVDGGGQLHIAAQTYRQGNVDFEPGPVSQDPNAFNKYNKIWSLRKTQVDSFRQGLFTIIPQAILTWPAHGDTAFGEPRFMAPFTDQNLNGIYEPLQGDYPCIKGDVCAYVIYNDNTGAMSLGASFNANFELMIYGFKTQNTLNNVLFTDYKISNPGTQTFNDIVVGNWVDLDIGNGYDDLVGTNVNTQSYFAYNADTVDDGPTGFGVNPPAFGITQLKGYDSNIGDGKDNNWDGCIDGIRDANGNCIAESVNNREEALLNSTINYFNVSSPSTGNPSLSIDHFYYLLGLWMDGKKLRVETPCGFDCLNNGDGYNVQDTGYSSRFLYPGNSFDTNGINEPSTALNWFNNPAYGSVDIRMVASSYPVDFSPNDPLHLSYAHVASRHAGTQDRNYSELQMDIKFVRAIDTIGSVCLRNDNHISIPELEHSLLNIFPNPANDYIVF